MNHDITAGVTSAVTESVTATPAGTVDRRVTAGVTEVVTDTVTRVALVTPVTFATLPFGTSEKEDAVRPLVAAIGIVGLIVGGHAIQAHLRSSRVAQAETKRGMSVYELHANKRDVKTLPEQEAPLP
jgi:hypothetical protein